MFQKSLKTGLIYHFVKPNFCIIFPCHFKLLEIVLLHMASLKQLHELIHKLDKNEKKFVSLMIQGVSGKAKVRYADAFRDINSVKIYDQHKLKQRLAAGVSGMNLSEANTNFYHFICRTLVAYHNIGTGNLGLQKELMLVEILINKGLHETAMKTLVPVLNQLKKTGTFGMLHRAQELQANLYLHNRKLNTAYKERAALYSERLASIQEHHQFVEINILNTSFFELALRIGDPRSKVQMQEYIQLAKSPLLQTSFEKITTRALSTFITLKLPLNNMTGKNEDVFVLGYKARNELKKRFPGNEYYTYDYFVIDYMMAEGMSMKLTDKVQECIAELQKLYHHLHHKTHKQKVLARVLMGKLTLCIWQKDWQKAEKLLNEWMAPSKRSEWIEAPLAYINFLCAARVLYLSKQPDKAIDYLLELQQYEKILRPSVMISYRFLFLLCHYKLHNYQLLSYSTESLYRSLLKMDKLYAPERALLRFVKKSNHFDKLKTELKKLSAEFEELEKDEYNKPFFSFGDYREWVNMELNVSKTG